MTFRKPTVLVQLVLLLAFLLPHPVRGEVQGRNVEVEMPGGQRWAVVIGVNAYLDPQIPDLKYCVADARRVFETLTKYGGFDPQRVLLIADDQPGAHLRPLRLNLQRQIGDWLGNSRPEDTVVVTFSGHGFVDEATGEAFLAPADCEKGNLKATGFPTEQLRQMLRDCPARQKLLILDCCHAGAVRAVQPTGATAEELSRTFAQAKGLITLASSRKDEVSHEWPAKQQGLFTYFLTEGLAGAADYDRDGVVNVDELYRFTFEKVRLAAQRELNARQHPVRVIGPDTEGVFALSRVPDRPAAKILLPQPRTVPFSSRIAPFGMQTPGWEQVGELGNNLQEIEREAVIVGDFVLQFTTDMVLGPRKRGEEPSFRITLVGAGGGDDLVIEGVCTNNWSGVDDWFFTTKAGQVNKSLARPQRAQDQTITLRRQGELITVEASPVFRPEVNDSVIAKFATGNAKDFQGVRLRISKNLTPREVRVH